MQMRFRLQAPLGVGPDGVVHRAVADRLGARPVALRRLPIPSGAARRTLRRDAETIASLGHPGLAVVEDIVEVDDDTVAVATTLGTRGTLADRRRRGALPVDEAVAVTRTVADAIGSAHRRGLAHGRLTATNVALTESGPVVCDLVQSAALHRAGDATRDTRDVIRLAASLVAPDDRSRRASAYRRLCRDAAVSAVDLDGFVAALALLGSVDEPSHPSPAVAPAPRPHADDGSFALVVTVSFVFGALVGAAGTLFPVVR